MQVRVLPVRPSLSETHQRKLRRLPSLRRAKAPQPCGANWANHLPRTWKCNPAAAGCGDSLERQAKILRPQPFRKIGFRTPA